MRIINPYEGVNFASTPRVPAISHEHIYVGSQLQSCYQRGIRIFACVNYHPSCPSVCPSGKLGLETDQNFSNWRIPLKDWRDDIKTTIPENFWDMSLAELEPYTTTRYYEGIYPTIVDKEGNTIYTESLPQIANCEYAFAPWRRGDIDDKPYFDVHHNMLGALVGYPLNGMSEANDTWFTPVLDGFNTIAEERAWRGQHPFYSEEELATFYKNTDYQQFDGKIFGTINHTNNIETVTKYLTLFPNVYRAMECFNQYCSVEKNKSFRNAYDEILKAGFKIWGTAATDWQGAREMYGGQTREEELSWIARFNALTEEEKAAYGDVRNYYDQTAVKECGDKDRGCNVLYITNYESLLNTSPQLVAEKALETYISGKYFMSAWGEHYPIAISVTEENATFTVNASSSKIRAITNLGIKETTGATISLPIERGISYVRFEAYFDDKDFVFTNPVFIDDNELPTNNIQKNAFILGVI